MPSRAPPRVAAEKCMAAYVAPLSRKTSRKFEVDQASRASREASGPHRGDPFGTAISRVRGHVMSASTTRADGPDPSVIVVGLVTLLVLVLGLAGAANAVDASFGAHSWMFAIAAALGLVGLLVWHEDKAPTSKRFDPTYYEDGVVKAGVVATMFWGIAGFLVGAGDRAAADLAEPLLLPRFRLDEFRPTASAAHVGRDLRLRRQRADRDVLLRRPAHLPHAPRRRHVAVVRVLGLPALHRHRRHRLPDGRHAVEGIRRAGMVCRHLADHRLGRLSLRLRRDDPAPQGKAHLCGELVLPRLHRHDRDAAHHQQPVAAGRALLARNPSRCSAACRAR